MDGAMTGTKRRRFSSQNSGSDGGGGGGGGSNSSARSGGAGGALGESVTTASVGSDCTGKAKKRFVWPDDLHRDFVAAIFDVGLKCASPKTILEMMTDTKDLTPDHIKSHLQKYRLHRERARAEFMSTYGKPLQNLSREQSATSLESLGGGGGGGDSGGERGAASAALRSMSAGGEDPFRGQMGLIRDCIQMQAGFQSVLRQALIQQTQLQQQLQAHLQALGFDGPTLSTASARASAAANAAVAAASAAPFNDYGQHNRQQQHQQQHQQQAAAHPGGGLPTMAESKGSHAQQQQAASVSASAGARQQHHHHHNHHGGGPGAKRSAEELMQAEMREHMDMHRQLVLRKNAQVSQYEGGQGPLSAAMGLHHPSSQAAAALAVGGLHGAAGPGAAMAGGAGGVGHQKPPHPPQAGHDVGGVGGQQQGQQLQQHGGGVDLDVDLASFKWNEDEDNLFSFLMDPPIG